MTYRPGLLASVSAQAAQAEEQALAAAATTATTQASLVTVQSTIANLQTKVAATIGTGGVTASNGTVALGVPIFGLGCFLDILSYGTPDLSGYASQRATLDAGLGFPPKSQLVFPGTWYAQAQADHNAAEAAAWASCPEANGSNGQPKMVPFLNFNMQSLDGTMTIDSIPTGANDAYIENFIQVWHDAGFLHVEIRPGWEWDYPTTPEGEDDQNGAYPSGTDVANSSDPFYKQRAISAVRHFTYVAKTKGASLGMEVDIHFEQAHINNCQLDPRDMDPDNDQSDGRGSLIGRWAMDFYFGNEFGVTTQNNYAGYSDQPIGSAPVVSSPMTDPNLDNWSKSLDNQLVFALFVDGYNADPDHWNGGVSWSFMIRHSILRPGGQIPLSNPELGGVTHYDGGTNCGLEVDINGNPNPTGGFYLSTIQANILRRLIAYAQMQGGSYWGGNLWNNEHPTLMLPTWAAAIPELKAGFSGTSPTGVPVPLQKPAAVVPPALTLSVTPGVDGVTLGMLTGAIRFYPLTQYTLYSSTSGGSLTRVGNINPVGGKVFVPQAAGSTASYAVTCSNVAGESLMSNTVAATVFATKTPPAGDTLTALSNNVGGQAYLAPIAAMLPGNNPFRFEAVIMPQSITNGGPNRFIESLWTAGASAGLAYAFLLDHNGCPNITYFDGTNYVGASASAPLPDSATSVPTGVAGEINPATGLVDFYTSADGVNWTVLGTEQTAPFKTPVQGTAVSSGTYYSIGGQNGGGGNDFIGLIFSAKLIVNGVTVLSPSFEALQVGATSVTDAQGNVFGINAAPGSQVVAISGLSSPGATAGTSSSTTSTPTPPNPTPTPTPTPTPAPTGGTPVLVQTASVNGTGTSALISLAAAPAVGNSVLLFVSGYSSGSSLVPTTPAGWIRVVDRVSPYGSNEAIVAFQAPVSALVNNGVSLSTTSTNANYGGMTLHEVEGSSNYAGAPLNVGLNGTTFSFQVPAQGATTPLRLGMGIYNLGANAGNLTASGGTILAQYNLFGNGAYVAFSQDGTAGVVFTQTGNQNVGGDVEGVGLEIS